MTAEEKRIAILRELASGRYITDVGYVARWSDGVRSPSLANALVARLWQQAFIERHRDGYHIIISETGRIWLKFNCKEKEEKG